LSHSSVEPVSVFSRALARSDEIVRGVWSFARALTGNAESPLLRFASLWFLWVLLGMNEKGQTGVRGLFLWRCVSGEVMNVRAGGRSGEVPGRDCGKRSLLVRVLAPSCCGGARMGDRGGWRSRSFGWREAA